MRTGGPQQRNTKSRHILQWLLETVSATVPGAVAANQNLVPVKLVFFWRSHSNSLAQGITWGRFAGNAQGSLFSLTQPFHSKDSGVSSVCSSLLLLICLSSQLTTYLWSVVLAPIKSTHSCFREKKTLNCTVQLASGLICKPNHKPPLQNPLLWKATPQPQKEDSSFPQETTLKLMQTKSTFSIKSFFVGCSPFFSREFPRAGERPHVTEQVICCEDTFLPTLMLISSIIMSRVSSALTSILMSDSCFKRQWARSLGASSHIMSSTQADCKRELRRRHNWDAVVCFK